MTRVAGAATTLKRTAARPAGRASAVGALLAALTLAQAATGPATGPRRPSIVLITVESLRSDRLGCYTGGTRRTPAIDALATRGIRFERAYAASPSTAPSVATILTGLRPARHRLRHDQTAFLAQDVRTLGTLLKRVGYRTGAVVGSFHLDHDRGLSRGFDLYDDRIEGLVKLVLGRSRERRAEEVVRKGLAFLDGLKKGEAFFLWLDLYDPHYDYDPPDPFKKEQASDPYQGEVAAVDAAIGTFTEGLRSRGLDRRADLILAGSHGEGLGDHGETGHGIYLYETTIRVPLIISPGGGAVRMGAAATEGRVVGSPVGLVDLAPTILDRAGVPVPAGLDGRSLAPVLEGKEAETGRRLFVEAAQPQAAYGWSPLLAVIEGDHKIVAGRRLEAFDLRADPGETRPLAPTPGWAATLEKFAAPLLGSLDSPAEMRRQVLAKAEDLPFPGRDQPFCQERTDWPDPRDRVPLNDPLFRARVEFDQGIVGRALSRITKEVLPTDPVNFMGLELIVSLGARGGDKATFLDNIALLHCNYPVRASSYHYLGHYLEGRQETSKAEEAFTIVALIEPQSEEPFYDLAALYAAQGKKDLALANLRKSIDRGATDFAYILKDRHFESIRSDPRFISLVAPAAPPHSPAAP